MIDVKLRYSNVVKIGVLLLLTLQLATATLTVQWEESATVTLCLDSVCARTMWTAMPVECVICVRKASSTLQRATLWAAKVQHTDGLDSLSLSSLFEGKKISYLCYLIRVFFHI